MAWKKCDGAVWLKQPHIIKHSEEIYADSRKLFKSLLASCRKVKWKSSADK